MKTQHREEEEEEEGLDLQWTGFYRELGSWEGQDSWPVTHMARSSPGPSWPEAALLRSLRLFGDDDEAETA